MSGEINIPNNSEIDKALREFDAKSVEEKQQELDTLKAPTVTKKEVTGISFETDNLKKVIPSLEDDTPKMVQLVMKWSGVKDQRQAEYILLGFVIVAIGVSVFLVFLKKNQKAKIEAPTGQKIIYSENAPPRLE